MDVEVELTKTAQQNAAAYYDKSKKARKKLAGIENRTPRPIDLNFKPQ